VLVGTDVAGVEHDEVADLELWCGQLTTVSLYFHSSLGPAGVLAKELFDVGDTLNQRVSSP
jgi:hypothetical protein